MDMLQAAKINTAGYICVETDMKRTRGRSRSSMRCLKISLIGPAFRKPFYSYKGSALPTYDRCGARIQFSRLVEIQVHGARFLERDS